MFSHYGWGLGPKRESTFALKFQSYGSPEGASIAVFKSLQNTHFHSILPFYYSLPFYSAILLLLPLYSSILRLRMSYIYYRVRICIILRVYIRTQRNVRLYIRCPSTATSPFIPREQLPMRANSHACLLCCSGSSCRLSGCMCSGTSTSSLFAITLKWDFLTS